MIISRLAQCVLDTLHDRACVDPEQSSIPIDELLSCGNSFDQCLLQSENIFQCAAELIVNASTSVEIITYWFEHDSDAAVLLRDALHSAAVKRQQEHNETGVQLPSLQVRVLANHSMLGALVGSGRGSMKRWTRDSELDSTYVNLQTAVHRQQGMAAIHAKYFIIDSVHVLITGDNVYKFTNFTPTAYTDTGYLLHGPIGRVLQKDFQLLWNQSSSCSVGWSPFQHSEDAQHSSQINGLNTFPIIALPRSPYNCVPGWKNEMLRNPHDQGYLAILYHAQYNIDIITPNCNALPFQQGLLHALESGIRIRLLLCHMGGVTNSIDMENSPGQGGDNTVTLKRLCKEYSHITQSALESGQWEIRWFSIDGVHSRFPNKAYRNHTKLLLADQMIAVVGSGNGDSQTWRHSAEMNLLLDSAEVTAQIEREIFNVQWSKSIPVREFTSVSEYLVMTLLFSLPILLVSALFLRFVYKCSGKDKEFLFLVLALMIILWIAMNSGYLQYSEIMSPWPVVSKSNK